MDDRRGRRRDRYPHAATPRHGTPGGTAERLYGAGLQVTGARLTVVEALVGRAAMPNWLATTAEYRRINDTPPTRPEPHAYLRHLLDIHPVGTPAQCVERLREAVAATGVGRLLLMVEGAGDPKRTWPTSPASAPMFFRRCGLMQCPAFENGFHYR